jgi:ectoine hydroxylase-related dioxygenase (phytanoyl-CoA dioxygenase family)
VRLSEQERDVYEHDGFIARRAVFAPAEVEELRATVEAVIADVASQAQRPDAGPEMQMADGHRLQFSSRTAIQWEWRAGSQEVRLIEPFTHLHPRFEALWNDARFVEPFKDILGIAEVAPYTCKLNLKRPREGSEFPWHQDHTYWYAFTPQHAHEIATAILFLDDATAANGAIRVLPGSHRRGAAPRDPDDPTAFLADPRPIDAAGQRLVEAEAGSLLFFPSLLLHRSSPNTSDRQRRALLLSFQPAGRPRQVDLEWRPDRVHALPLGPTPSVR